MGWLTENEEGSEMERRLNDIIHGLMLLTTCGLYLFCGLMLWILFKPQIQTGLRFLQGLIF